MTIDEQIARLRVEHERLLRTLWLLVARALWRRRRVRWAIEAAFNAARPHPPNTWSTGARLYKWDER